MSSKISNIIKTLDIVYGNHFQFRIADQSKYKTFTGGVLTILTLIILFFCTVTFSNDFLYMKKPRMYIEEGLYLDKDIPSPDGSVYPEKPGLVTVAKTFSTLLSLR
jgi:hypothetical protein